MEREAKVEILDFLVGIFCMLVALNVQELVAGSESPADNADVEAVSDGSVPESPAANSFAALKPSRPVNRPPMKPSQVVSPPVERPSREASPAQSNQSEQSTAKPAEQVTQQSRDIRRPSAAERSSEALVDIAMRHFRKRRYVKCDSLLKQALKKYPRNAFATYILVLTARRGGRLKDAEGLLNAAIDLERENAVPGWGERMSRIQGRDRVWVEDARKVAGVGLYTRRR